MSDWIPVSERLPYENVAVLIALKNGDVTAGFFDEGEWYLLETCHCLENRVTHWIPFPPPPEAE